MGKNDIFTFVTIAEIPKGNEEYSLKITKLPFVTLDEKGTRRLSLIPETVLATFATEAVK
jgi:hypothetical protein